VALRLSEDALKNLSSLNAKSTGAFMVNRIRSWLKAIAATVRVLRRLRREIYLEDVPSEDSARLIESMGASWNGNISVLRVRRRLPYPKLWAKLAGARIPDSYVTGKITKLNRPEGLAISRSSGEMMAISNSGNHSITLYARDGASHKNYDMRPRRTISERDCLKFVHDVVFTPCGKYYIAVGRDSYSLSAFEIVHGKSDAVDSKPLYSVTGEKHGLCYPAGVAIHPCGEWLAVANRLRVGISLYRISGINGQFESSPFQFITEEELSIHELAAPHGLDFSPDGKSLIVVHNRFAMNKNSKGESGIAVFQCRNNTNSGLNPNPSFIYPYGCTRLHSVAVHPSGCIVAVSNSLAGVDLFDWLPEQSIMSKRDTFSFFRHEEGPKGVAFTSDGKQLAVTTALDEVLFFDL